MSDELKLKIVLDDGSVKEGFLRIEKTAEGSSKKIEKSIDTNVTESFSDGLTSIATKFAVVGAAAFAVGSTLKKTLDFALLGEATKAVEKQFDTLAESAGIAGDKLKEGLIASTKGLIDDEDALQIATKGIVALGKEAERLPQIMDIARNASKALGKDFTQSFEQMSGFIENGNAKVLKQYGLILDLDEAYKKAAKGIGLTAAELSEAQKQTVRMNLFLDEAAGKFSGTAKSVTPLKDALDRLFVTFGNFKEDTAVKFYDNVGGAIERVINKINGLISQGPSLKDALLYLSNPALGITYVLGGAAVGADKLSLSVEDLKKKIDVSTTSVTKLNDQIESLQKLKSETAPGDVAGLSGISVQLDNAKRKVLETKTEINQLYSLLSKKMGSEDQSTVLPKKEKSSSTGLERNAEQDKLYNKRRQDSAAELTSFLLNEELKRLNSSLQIDEIKLSQEKNYDAQVAQQKAISAKQLAVVELENKINVAVVDKQFADAEKFSQAEKNLALESAELSHQEKMKVSKETALKKDKELADKSREYFKQVELDAKRSLGAGVGQAFASFGRALATGEDAAQAFLDSMMGVFADIAIQLGTSFILQGIGWSANPATPGMGAGMITAGIALATFGGLLKGFSGGKSGASSGSADSGGGIAASPNMNTEMTPPEQMERVEPGTKVSVVIQGDVLDSDESGSRIVNLINTAFDKKGVVIQQGAFA